MSDHKRRFFETDAQISKQPLESGAKFDWLAIWKTKDLIGVWLPRLLNRRRRATIGWRYAGHVIPRARNEKWNRNKLKPQY